VAGGIVHFQSITDTLNLAAGRPSSLSGVYTSGHGSRKRSGTISKTNFFNIVGI